MKIKEDEKNMNSNFRTSDLNLAAFLKAKYDFNLKNVERSPEDIRRVFFVFDSSGMNIAKAVESFYQGEEVSALALVQELSNLKSMARNLAKAIVEEKI